MFDYPVYPAESTYGIPWLDITRAAETIAMPVYPWGTNSRRRKHPGTYHFYVDDFKFSALKKHPKTLPDTGCPVAIEINFSTWDSKPAAIVLNDIYYKRLIARFWQSCGIRVIVDMNVSRKYMQYNLLGIPRGWPIFAYRSHRQNDLEFSDLCKFITAIAGSNHTLILYGGSDRVIQEAEASFHGRLIVWPEYAQTIRSNCGNKPAETMHSSG